MQKQENTLNEIISTNSNEINGYNILLKQQTIEGTDENIEIMKDLTSLESLCLTGNCTEKHLKKLKNLTNVRHISLAGCKLLKDISILQSFTGITDLNIQGLEIQGVDQTLQYLTNISSLRLDAFVLLQGNPGMKVLLDLPKLSVLKLHNCADLHDIDVIGNITNLTWLELHSLRALDNEKIKVIKNLTNLNRLEIDFGQKITNLKCISKLTKLDFLRIASCSINDGLLGFDKLTKLKSLIINERTINSLSDSDIDNIKKITSLTKLSLHLAKNTKISKPIFKDISKLKNLNYLSIARLDQCTNESVEELEKLTNLTFLSLAGCENLTIDSLDTIKKILTLKCFYPAGNWNSDEKYQKFKTQRGLVYSDDGHAMKSPDFVPRYSWAE
jgi:internalin A